jgi:hypothetical protein
MRESPFTAFVTFGHHRITQGDDLMRRLPAIVAALAPISLSNLGGTAGASQQGSQLNDLMGQGPHRPSQIWVVDVIGGPLPPPFLLG